MDYHSLLDLTFERKYIAHCHEGIKRDKLTKINSAETLILIGPEGDFTQEEIASSEEAGFVGLDLGTYRLRTETAALTALSQANFL